VTDTVKHDSNPLDRYLRVDRIPHIWCAGCGIGPAASCFIKAIDRSEVEADNIALV
jgi:2-oxoglutarate ferredoxin oxidoreductase subunit beta